jgi:hypothetical protein
MMMESEILLVDIEIRGSCGWSMDWEGMVIDGRGLMLSAFGVTIKKERSHGLL